MDEDRYEAIELIVRSKPDGESWFDIIADRISKDCQGSDVDPCTCGLESLGGTSGTLDDCYRHFRIADDLVEVEKADLLLVLDYYDFQQNPRTLAQYEALQAAADRMRKKCTWWEDYLAATPPSEDEEG